MKFELFNAILSMDSYHRGYDRGIKVRGDGIGIAEISEQSNTQATSVEVNEGFYAVAYDVQGAGTIIAYRGTDYPSGGDAGTLSDLDDWLQGGGSPGGQSAMAIDFYQNVANAKNQSYQSASITTTGHSLGGGLAGLVSSIYDKDGVLFDNMAFETASHNVRTMAESSVSLRNDIYNGQTPWDTDHVGLHTYSIKGEVLSGNRISQGTGETELMLGNDVNFGDYSLPYSFYNIITNIGEAFSASLARHSMASLVIRMFADENEQISDRDWEASAKYFWPVLYNNAFAASMGYDNSNNIDISGQYQSNGQFADILRTAMAYSAIDAGATVFGDTGIRALYDDANDWGAALIAARSTTIDGEVHALDLYQEGLAKSLVAYAGGLARNKITTEMSEAATEGVFISAQTEVDHSLTIDVRDASWNLAEFDAFRTVLSGHTPIPADQDGKDIALSTEVRKLLVQPILEGSGNFPALSEELNAVWGDPSMHQFDFVTFSTDPDIAAAMKTGETEDSASLFAGYNTDEAVRGSSGRDLIMTHGGQDTIYGSLGLDLISGGDGMEDVLTYEDMRSGLKVDLRDAEANSALGDLFVEVKDVADAELNNFTVRDFVFDTETIKLSQEADTVEVSKTEGFGALLFDGLDGEDTIDFTAITETSVGMNMHTGVSSTGTSFENFDRVIGTDHDDGDTFYGTGRSVAYHGGEGADTLSYSFLSDIALEVNLPENAIRKYGVASKTPEVDYVDGVEIFYGSNKGDYFRLGDITSGMEFHAGGNPVAEKDILDLTDAGGVGVNLATSTILDSDLDSATITGFETVYGSRFADSIVGDWSTNWLYGGLGDDTISGGGGDDYLFAQYDSNILHGDSGSDVYYFDDLSGTATITDSSGIADEIYLGGNYVFEGHDTVTTTATGLAIPNKVTFSSGEIEYLRYSDGVVYEMETLERQAPDNYTVSGDYIAGTSGDDILIGTDDDDTFYAMEGGSDLIDGGSGFDTVSYANSSSGVTVNLKAGTGDGSSTLGNINGIIGSDYSDTLYGTDFNDIIRGRDGADTIRGGKGDDILSAAGGYIFGDEGHDWINGGGILFGGAGDDHLTGSGYLYGEEGDDFLIATQEGTTLSGGDGTNYLEGAENTTYFAGNGLDVISDRGSNGILNIGSFSAADAVYQRADNDSLVISGNGKKIVVLDHFSEHALEYISYDGGDTLLQVPRENIDVYEDEFHHRYEITNNNTLNEPVDYNYVIDNGENSTFSSFEGAHTYYFDMSVESGVTKIQPITVLDKIPQNTLVFNDISPDAANIIYGSPADNSFFKTYNLSFGTSASIQLLGDVDSYTFAFVNDGVTENYSFHDLGFVTYGTAADDGNLSGDRPKVSNDDVIYGGYGNDEIRGLLGNDTIYGDQGDDELYGNEGDDVLDGGEGNDTLGGGEGNDLLIDSAGNDTYRLDDGDTLQVGSGHNRVVVSGLGEDKDISNITIDFSQYTESIDDLKIVRDLSDQYSDPHTELDDAILSYQGGRLLFSDHTEVLGTPNIRLSDDNVLSLKDLDLVGIGGETGESYNERLNTVFSMNDTIYAKGGDDSYNLSYGTDFVDGGDGDDTIIKNTWNTDWDTNTTEEIIGTLIAYGRAGNDVLYGGSQNDELYGGAGDDIIYGAYPAMPSLVSGERVGDGGDKLYGGLGNDTIHSDLAGDDIIDGGEGNDTITALTGVSGHVIDLESQSSWNSHGTASFSNIENAVGSSHDDELYGNSYSNMLTGWVGDDVLHGKGGNDIYVYSGKSDQNSYPEGHDIIEESGGERDVIMFGNLDDISQLTLIYDDTDLQISFSSGSVTILDQYSAISAKQVEYIALADGTEYSLLDTSWADSSDDDFTGNETEQSFVGSDSEFDTVDYSNSTAAVTVDLEYGSGYSGYADSDSYESIEGVIGSDYDDYLIGGATVNELYGGKGNDFLEGGAGDDYLAGGEGDDEYIFYVGHGVNTINETSGFDTIYLGSDIVLSDLNFSQQGDDLHIEIASGFIVTDFYSGDSSKHVEEIMFSDGSTFNLLGLLNTDPVAQPDTFTGNEDTVITGNVLSNDSDADGDVLSAVAGTFTSAQGGSIDLLSDGSFTYTPANGFTGDDSFQYTLTDGQGGTDTGVVSWIIAEDTSSFLDFTDYTINGYENQDVEGTHSILDGGATLELTGNTWKSLNYDYMVTENTILEFEYKITNPREIHALLLENDNIFNNGEIRFQFAGSQTGSGWLQDYAGYNAAGEWVSYEIDIGSYLTDFSSLVFVNDDDANSLAESAFKNIRFYEPEGVGASPQAQNDVFSTLQNVAVNGNVLADNGYGVDSDPNGDSLSVIPGTYMTSHGSLVIASDGNFTYTPSPDFYGDDHFTYTLEDGHGGSDTGLMSFDVEPDFDTITPLVAGIGEAESISDAGALLNGLNEITVSLWIEADHTGTDGGIFDTEARDKYDDILTIRHDAQGWLGGGDSLIKVGLMTTEGEVQLESSSHVHTTNMQNITMTWKSGEGIKLYIDGIEDTPTYSGAPVGGVLTGINDLILKGGGYYPLSGTVHDIRIYDAQFNAQNVQSLASLTPNQQPSAQNDAVLMVENTTVTFDVLANDSDPEGDALNIVNVTQGAHGVVIDNGDGTISYTPSTDFVGTDSITYTVGDGNGKTHDAVVTVNISDNVNNDTMLVASDAAEFVIGGGEENTVDYSQSTDSVIVDLINQSGSMGYADGDTYYSIENIIGANAATSDELYGNEDANDIYGGSGSDYLYGNSGDDLLYGGSGNDVISGGEGIDMLYGQDGADTFIFEADSAFLNSDNVQDFDLSENDTLDISDVLEGYAPLADVITDFVQITENGSNSYLHVDADGNGDDFVQVAYLYNATGLTDEEALETSGNLITA